MALKVAVDGRQSVNALLSSDLSRGVRQRQEIRVLARLSREDDWISHRYDQCSFLPCLRRFSRLHLIFFSALFTTRKSKRSERVTK